MCVVTEVPAADQIPHFSVQIQRCRRRSGTGNWKLEILRAEIT